MSFSQLDISTHTLHSAVNLTTGFSSTPMNRDAMSGYALLIKTTINTTTSSVVYNLQASIDGTTYVGIDGSTTTVSSTGNLLYDVDTPHYSYVLVQCTATTAHFNVTITARAIRI